MAIALVNSATQTADNFTSDATAVLTVPSTTTGNLLVHIVQYASTNRTVSSVTGGATYTSLHRKVYSAGGDNGVIEIFAGICTAGVTSVTTVLSGNDTFGTFSRTSLLEFSGAADPLAESGTSTEADSGGTGATTLSCSSVSCDAADTLFIAAAILSGSIASWSEDADFTNYVADIAAPCSKIAYRIQNGSSTAQGWDPSWETTRNYLAALVGIRGTAGGNLIPTIMKHYRQRIT